MVRKYANLDGLRAAQDHEAQKLRLQPGAPVTTVGGGMGPTECL